MSFKYLIHSNKSNFKKVTTKEDLAIFKDIWLKACVEMEYESEPFPENAVRYLVTNKKGDYIGTIEFIPYNPDEFSTIEKYHSFREDREVFDNKEFVYEVDKVAILKEHRKSWHVFTFLEIMMANAVEYDSLYYLGFMEKMFFRLARIYFKGQPIQVSKEWVWDEHTLIPVKMDVKKSLKVVESKNKKEKDSQ